MAVLNIYPRMLTSSDVGAGTTTQTIDFTVPSGKRWLIGIIEGNFGTAASNNTLDIQVQKNGGSFANIWPQIANQNKMAVEPESRYPRAIEIEDSGTEDVLRLIFTRGTSTTVTNIRVFVMESDL